MKGYIRVATIMPEIKAGNIQFNINNIKTELLNANSLGAKFCLLPELSITGLNLQDLYFDNNILNESINALLNIANYSLEFDMIIVLSLPFKYENNIYETAVVIKSGKILGMVPKEKFDKKNINYKYFSNANNIHKIISLYDDQRNIKYDTPFSNNLIFKCDNYNFSIAFNENIKNTNIVANIMSIPETIDVDDYFRNIKYLSKQHNNIIVTSSAGPNESSSYYTYFGRSIIAECGEIIAKNDIISNKILFSDVDIDKASFYDTEENDNCEYIYFSYDNVLKNNLDEKLYREFDKHPYINKKTNAYNYCMHIINILAVALSKRMKATKCNEIIIGVSGGLDSTFALLVAKKAIDFLSLNTTNIHAYSLPSYGTTDNSNKNIKELLKSLDIVLNEINISDAISMHFQNINHDINNTNVTFENAQARERMQVLMDIANDLNGLVLGTSDLSEIALGFSTYNGDHMSMYNVNGSLPKTLIKYILNTIAEENIKNNNNILLANTLKNILHSPISPELLPTENGMLIQKTEEILGNYEIHDFILYNYLKYHYDIYKLYDLSIRTFVYNNDQHIYTDEYIKNCINLFFKRFFKAQYKRTTAPDSPSIGLPNLNKITDYIIPSDTEINFEL